MSSDLTITQSTVVAIQGNAISTNSPEDGYALIWNDADGYWQPLPISTSGSGLRKAYFTADGYWTAPDGIENVLIFASAGGWGGDGGRVAAFNSAGGKSAGQGIGYVQVTPSTTYSIFVGLGGAGGTGEHKTGTSGFVETVITPYTLGQAGGTTFFKESSTVLFKSTSGDFPISITNLYSNGIAGGGTGAGGFGGDAGTNGNGANGGDGLTSSTGGPSVANNGSNAASTSGAGGGAGGCADHLNFPYNNTGGNGGNGGSGYMYIIY